MGLMGGGDVLSGRRMGTGMPASGRRGLPFQGLHSALVSFSKSFTYSGGVRKDLPS